MLHVPGADADADAGDRSYLVLVKPNVIINGKIDELAAAKKSGLDEADRRQIPLRT